MSRLDTITNMLLDCIEDERLRSKLREEAIREVREAWERGYERGHEDCKGQVMEAVERVQIEEEEA